jgi:glycosyltransferase involved in cell wall biosynthesis
MNSMPRLSALVVARNEEARLDRCLAALAFADELVVVLDRTTDGSAAIAARHEARLVEGAWPLERDRRNTGLASCTGDWIVEIDADEIVPKELAREIRETIGRSTHDWHLLPVDNLVGTRVIRWGWAGSFGTTAVPRLTRRGVKRWGEGRVHPPVTLNGREGPRLVAALQHHLDRDISDMIKRLDRYSSAKADDLRAGGDPDPTRTYVRRFFTRFWKSYVSRRGYREGGWGLLIALLTALSPLLAHLKAKLEPRRDA